MEAGLPAMKATGHVVSGVGKMLTDKKHETFSLSTSLQAEMTKGERTVFSTLIETQPVPPGIKERYGKNWEQLLDVLQRITIAFRKDDRLALHELLAQLDVVLQQLLHNYSPLQKGAVLPVQTKKTTFFSGGNDLLNAASDADAIEAKLLGLLRTFAQQWSLKAEEFHKQSTFVKQLLREMEKMILPQHGKNRMTPSLSGATNEETGHWKKNSQNLPLENGFLSRAISATDKQKLHQQQSPTPLQQSREHIRYSSRGMINKDVSFSQPMNAIWQYVVYAEPGAPDGLKSFFTHLARWAATGYFSYGPTGGQQFQIRLVPEHLGPLMIRISQENGQISATITTRSAEALHLVESQLHHLKHALSVQNVTYDRLEVLENPGAFEQRKDFADDRREEPEQKRDSQQIEDDDPKSEDQTFTFLQWLKKQWG